MDSSNQLDLLQINILLNLLDFVVYAKQIATRYRLLIHLLTTQHSLQMTCLWLYKISGRIPYSPNLTGSSSQLGLFIKKTPDRVPNSTERFLPINATDSNFYRLLIHCVKIATKHPTSNGARIFLNKNVIMRLHPLSGQLPKLIISCYNIIEQECNHKCDFIKPNCAA